MDEVEIIKLHKRCNKKETKRGAKAKARTGSKVESKRGAEAGAKALRSGYHHFLREQLEKMTGRLEKLLQYCVMNVEKD